MNERPATKLWKDLSSQDVEQFFKLLAKRADGYQDLAYKTTLELAKYLFAANTGAAAGIFFLLKSAPGQFWYLFSFFIFCSGTFFVGLSYLTLANWSRKIADGASRDLSAWGRNEITVEKTDANDRDRHALRQKTAEFWGLWVAFVCLIGGAITAAVPLCRNLH